VPKLTQERAYEVLHLDVETGVLTWRVRTGSRTKVGQRAGWVHQSKGQGYRWVSIDGKKYHEHVLIWFMLYGEWAPRKIDHHDLNRANNKPSNLRKADESQQRSNAKLRSDNALGERGVSFHTASGLYMAEVRYRDYRFVKGFHTAAEAAIAARAERLRVFGKFAPSIDQQGV
jgi:hypothetical protein